MADNTKIEWTDATWNPITGCSLASPGCTNCYAMKLAGTRMKHHPSRAGLTLETKAGPVWNGEVRLNEQWITQPLQWKRPRMIFVCAHADLFHESVPDEWIDRVFAVMALAPQHTFQVLTKRASRMRQYFSENSVTLRDRWYRSVPAGRWPVSIAESYAAIHPHCSDETRALHHRTTPVWPLPNVWLGVSVEDQKRADERIPDLLATPAAVRWISAEPLLGPADILPYLFIYTHADSVTLEETPANVMPELPWRDPATTPAHEIDVPRLDWVVVGGESGPNARPMHPDWARSLRDQCAAAGVPFHFKQWGEFHPADHLKTAEQTARMRDMGHALRDGHAHAFDDQWTWRIGKKAAGRLLDGVEHNGKPEAH